ncbi:NADPH-dependent FMN reductase [Phaeovulum sp. W22_SRMD_FR3]
MRVAGLCGSLRRGSYNRYLLQACADALPAGAQYNPLGYDDLPAFDADLLEAPRPETARVLADGLAAADAIIIASPEYNYSVPGALKNAIDWVSRDPRKPFAGKPVLLLSASTSMLGGVRMQYHLRQILVFLEAHPLNRPEIFISQAALRFDDTGQLTDPVALDLLVQAGAALGELHQKLSSVKSG